MNGARRDHRSRFGRLRRRARRGSLWRRRRRHARPHRRALRGRRRRPRGFAGGAAQAAQSRCARPWARHARINRAQAARLCVSRAARTMGLRRRDLARQGYALGPLGDRRHAGRLRLGLFSAQDSRASGRVYARADRGGEAARHSRRPPCLRHAGDRGFRRRACQDRQADLLHVCRFRVADRRARGSVRPRAPLRNLPHRAQTLRSAQHRPRDREAVSSARTRRISSAPRTARISRFRRCPATCSSAPPRRGARLFRSARSATFSRIETPGSS